MLMLYPGKVRRVLFAQTLLQVVQGSLENLEQFWSFFQHHRHVEGM